MMLDNIEIHLKEKYLKAFCYVHDQQAGNTNSRCRFTTGSHEGKVFYRGNQVPTQKAFTVFGNPFRV